MVLLQNAIIVLQKTSETLYMKGNMINDVYRPLDKRKWERFSTTIS